MGTLEREMRLCADYARMGWRVKVLSFKRESIAAYGLPFGITVVRFPHARLLPLLPVLRLDLGIWADVIKTNQSAGSWDYVRAARWWHKPILLRCGYVAGRNLELEDGKTSAVCAYQSKEASAFAAADRIQVTTPLLAEWVRDRYGVAPEKLAVLPNFVETELFAPGSTDGRMPKSVISVGRLSRVKRFDLLIAACSKAGVQTLTLIGEGPERAALESLAMRLQMKVAFAGRISNREIPRILCRHEVYAQVSLYEGHPKSLLEAMACGLTCLVSDSPGLREQVEHGTTGWVAGSSVESMTEGLIALMNNEHLRTTLGSAARRHIVDTMAYEKIRDREFKTLLDMAGLRNHG
jgi:glycosyltransferase involved in cell wall biosynthesis